MDQRELIPVDGHPDLARDPRTGMILNINNDKINNAKRSREIILKQREEIKQLKQDVADIKTMLAQLIENSTNGS